MNHKKITISLCMIGQDEADIVEANLANCIEYVDEIIFLDGGSKDDTVNIVSGIPKARVYQYIFDSHTNQSNRVIKLATSCCVLMKDCDEIFPESLLQSIQGLYDYAELGYEAFAFPRNNYIDGKIINKEDDKDYQVKFWLNMPKIRFMGWMHPILTGANKLFYSDIPILHYKTMAMQKKDAELYWRMGQPMPPGVRYNVLKDEFEYKGDLYDILCDNSHL